MSILKKRVTVFCGHYGSGKTNLAVNLALRERAEHPEKKITVADLDIVNPYFRTEDSRAELESAGIRLICSPYANSNLDIPALPDDLYAIVDDKEATVLVDVGGDERGALALGRLTEALLAEGDYDMFAVVNGYRPLTKDAEDTLEVLREIEGACGLRFTGILNNSNLGEETTAETVLSSLPYAESVEKITGLPTVAIGAREDLVPSVREKTELPVIPLHLQKKPTT